MIDYHEFLNLANGKKKIGARQNTVLSGLFVKS